MNLEPGDRLGDRYQLLSKLGEGGRVRFGKRAAAYLGTAAHALLRDDPPRAVCDYQYLNTGVMFAS
jgi:hypothetical protein